jgi:hypothetical protein
MDDRALYAPIHGVGRPWEVTRVELNDGRKRCMSGSRNTRGRRLCAQSA